MRVRLLLLAFMVILVPNQARADDHRADLYGGFSGGGGGSALYGFHQALALTSPQPGSKDLSFVVPDLSVHFGSHDGSDVTQVALMFGGRLTPVKENWRHTVSVQVLVGTVYTNEGGAGDADWAMSFGGLYELPLTTRSTPYYGWAFRAQIDYINRFSDTRDDLPRLSAGLSYRFAK
jgi:hypothetical protein